MTTANGRTADHPIDPLFLERFSPRAFTGETIPESDLLTILEAASWAPSSYNSQPWRFLHARRDTMHWEKFFDLLVPGNQKWVKDTAAIVYLVSSSTMTTPAGEVKPSRTHSFDAGTASALLQLQAIRMGWHAHGMVGFDYDRAFVALNVPEGYRIEAVYAIGRKADPASLSEEQRGRETPNGRKPLSELVFEGGFPPREA
ncbi:nitroreductase family protein [uncultured Methylobacterium sp.]|uniref:nitroreductase family protein n=1 Tax=uncultured Methylobacterium sp. TaxID=157278 RepID=UPI002627AE1B|nr:nitroreductase family protein [uncultured Methylobacterium sp.]